MNKISNISNYIRDKHDRIYKVSLFILAIVAIVFFLPREVEFKYDFQKNKPWFHEDLLAPYDIPVYKSEQEIETEEIALKNAQRLYFRYDESVNNNLKVTLSKNLNKGFENYYQNRSLGDKIKQLSQNAQEEKNSLKQEALGLLNRVLESGIIENAHTEGFSDSTQFYVAKNSFSAAYVYSDVYTPKTAVEYIEKHLKNNSRSKAQFLYGIFSSTLSGDAANLKYDKEKTEKAIATQLKRINRSRGEVLRGQSIIQRGDIVDEYKFKVLKSFEQVHQEQQLSKQKVFNIILGQSLLVSIVVTCLALYLIFFRPKLLEDNKNIVFLLWIVVSAVVFTSIVVKQNFFNIYVVPLSLIPLIIRSFFDSRTAFFVLLIAVLLIGFVVPNGLHFIFIQIVAGMVGLYGFVNFRSRAQLFLTSVLILLSYSLCYFALNIVIEGELGAIDWYTFGWMGIASFLTLLAYPVIYIFEKSFGFVSDITLLELADTNNKLLRELSRKAPGTFQHSLQVANLAEAAIQKIEGNALLIRTAALYHDIGKMEAPMYFIENQSTGVNPHDELAYEESAQIIIGHVLNGIEIAKKNNIPDLIIDFIRTHHGSTKTEYFYRKQREENPDELDEKDFTYPGPIPFSKESAVLMMADSVEAASRSIKKPNVETIDALVEGVIGSQIAQDQFVNANITLKDITQIKKIFKKMLINIYHVRVEYPH